MLDLYSSIGVGLFCFGLLLAFLVYHLRSHERMIRRDINETKHVILLIAHPDDESMFFLPMIYALKNEDCFIEVVCVTNGNSKVRQEEMETIAKVIPLDKLTVLDLSDIGIIDSFGTKWDTKTLSRALKPYIKNESSVQVVTFDDNGISGHENHISLYYAALELKEEVPNPKYYSLKTVSILRKYIIPFDVIILLLKDLVTVICSCCRSKRRDSHLFVMLRPWRNWKCMATHHSQFVWFRKLFVFFSRYTFINEINQIY